MGKSITCHLWTSHCITLLAVCFVEMTGVSHQVMTLICYKANPH